MALIIEEIQIDTITDTTISEENKDITENEYLEMAQDCKFRILSKNRTIQKLQKKLILIYALVERFMEVEDPAFIEEARIILDKILIDDIGIQDIE